MAVNTQSLIRKVCVLLFLTIVCICILLLPLGIGLYLSDTYKQAGIICMFLGGSVNLGMILQRAFVLYITVLEHKENELSTPLYTGPTRVIRKTPLVEV